MVLDNVIGEKNHAQGAASLNLMPQMPIIASWRTSVLLKASKYKSYIEKNLHIMTAIS